LTIAGASLGVAASLIVTVAPAGVADALGDADELGDDASVDLDMRVVSDDADGEGEGDGDGVGDGDGDGVDFAVLLVLAPFGDGLGDGVGDGALNFNKQV
jgi:hypothetical protein